MKKILIGLVFASCISLCACSQSEQVKDKQAAEIENVTENVTDNTVETAKDVEKETAEVTENVSEAADTTSNEKAEDEMFSGIPKINVSSPNVKDGVWETRITKTDKGENISPQINWDAVEGAINYAVFMLDLTAANWIHMDVYTTDNFIDEGELKDTPRGHQYVGPYPPSGTHTYTIYVLALKNDVNKVKFMFDSASINNSIEKLVEGHDTDVDGNSGNVIAIGRLDGTYTFGD